MRFRISEFLCLSELGVSFGNSVFRSVPEANEREGGQEDSRTIVTKFPCSHTAISERCKTGGIGCILTTITEWCYHCNLESVIKFAL